MKTTLRWGSNPEQAWKFIGKYRTMQQHLTAVEANKNTPHHRMIPVARSVYVKSISVTD